MKKITLLFLMFVFISMTLFAESNTQNDDLNHAKKMILQKKLIENGLSRINAKSLISEFNEEEIDIAYNNIEKLDIGGEYDKVVLLIIFIVALSYLIGAAQD